MNKIALIIVGFAVVAPVLSISARGDETVWLVIHPRLNAARDDAMTGQHAMRTTPVELPGGRKGFAGCVPCFSALTFIAVLDGKAYAVNGATKNWMTRYAVQIGSTKMQVHKFEDRCVEMGKRVCTKWDDTATLIQSIASVRGCEIPPIAGVLPPCLTR